MLKLKGNKGITLIALIITIIVLLILAGVTISAINGNENTMGKAKIAKEENEIANELEAIKLAITDAMAKGLNGKVSDVHLRESIAGIIDDSELNNISGEGPWTIKTKLGKTYEINGYGQIEPAATPTDIYVTLDGDTLRFYAQKDNVSGTLVKEKNSDEPINLRGEGFTKSASDNPWYNNTNIKKVSFEEVVVPTSTMRWFVNCSGITNIENIERLNTRYVTNMNRMFYGCSGLTELDLSKFSTENVTDMRCMFYNCSNLITIYVGDKWNTDAVTQSEYMFSNCKNLTGGAGTIYSSSYIDKSRAKIDGGDSNPGYFVDKKIGIVPLVGDYIEYDVAYSDMYNTSTDYSTTNGWKILDVGTKNSDGKYEGVKIISTGVPAEIRYENRVSNGNTWWDTSKTGNAYQAEAGLASETLFKNITFDGDGSDSAAGKNKGRYRSITNSDQGIGYNAGTGAVFITKKANGVHNLTLNEFNTALNVINGKSNGDVGYRDPETCIEKNTNKLFFVYRDCFWFATAHDNNYLYYLDGIDGNISYNGQFNSGLKPVINLKPVTLTWNGTYWKVE